MATQTFDMSGLILLQNALAAMTAAEVASPTVFTGQTSFVATYKGVPNYPASSLETTTTITQKLNELRYTLDMLNR